MSKRALCVGINDYPIRGMDLKGCVNDAKSWAGALTQHFDFASGDVTVLLDGDATKRRIITRLKALLRGARRGDVLVFTNSSHGTYIADTDGDEDRFDEALCPWDCDDRLIVDDELRVLFDALPAGVRFTFVSDSCHSGTVTRALPAFLNPDETFLNPDKRRVRFLNPRLLGLPELRSVLDQRAWSTRTGRPESVMKEVLVSGCRDIQYSYDAKIGSRYHGAMTYYSLQALERARWSTSYKAWVPRVNALLRDGGYDQSPQLEGRAEAKTRKVFR
jgi:hypothetical protein